MCRVLQQLASQDFRSSRSGCELPAGWRLVFFTALLLMAACSLVSTGQAQSALLETGHVAVAGKQLPYRIRHLPVNAFPDLPDAVASALTVRRCLIPQTYGAHGPENVIHGSFERRGVADWAVLCSSGGKVSLLVFLASGSPSAPVMLDSAPVTDRLQQDDISGELGFAWGIDSATPKQVHDGMAGSQKRQVTPDNDCIAESVVDRAPVYRCLQAGKWVAFDSQ
jgi:hypothetical protein